MDDDYATSVAAGRVPFLQPGAGDCGDDCIARLEEQGMTVLALCINDAAP
jgi:hypothetical protein